MSTQRLLVILISLNLIISICVGIAVNPRELNDGKVNEFASRLGYYGNDLSEEDDIQSAESLQEEGTFGSAGSMGKGLFTLFIQGLHPFPFRNMNQDDNVIQLLVIVLNLFRGLLTILIGLEVFMLIKGNKTT